MFITEGLCHKFFCVIKLLIVQCFFSLLSVREKKGSCQDLPTKCLGISSSLGF